MFEEFSMNRQSLIRGPSRGASLRLAAAVAAFAGLAVGAAQADLVPGTGQTTEPGALVNSTHFVSDLYLQDGASEPRQLDGQGGSSVENLVVEGAASLSSQQISPYLGDTSGHLDIATDNPQLVLAGGSAATLEGWSYAANGTNGHELLSPNTGFSASDGEIGTPGGGEGSPFVTVPVPLPSAVAMSAIGCLVIARRRRPIA